MKQWHEAEKKEMAVQAEASEAKLKKTITNLKTNLKQLTSQITSQSRADARVLRQLQFEAGIGESKNIGI